MRALLPRIIFLIAKAANSEDRKVDINTANQ